MPPTIVYKAATARIQPKNRSLDKDSGRTNGYALKSNHVCGGGFNGPQVIGLPFCFQNALILDIDCIQLDAATKLHPPKQLLEA